MKNSSIVNLKAFAFTIVTSVFVLAPTAFAGGNGKLDARVSEACAKVTTMSAKDCKTQFDKNVETCASALNLPKAAASMSPAQVQQYHSCEHQELQKIK